MLLSLFCTSSIQFIYVYCLKVSTKFCLHYIHRSLLYLLKYWQRSLKHPINEDHCGNTKSGSLNIVKIITENFVDTFLSVTVAYFRSTCLWISMYPNIFDKMVYKWSAESVSLNFMTALGQTLQSIVIRIWKHTFWVRWNSIKVCL